MERLPGHCEVMVEAKVDQKDGAVGPLLVGPDWGSRETSGLHFGWDVNRLLKRGVHN